MKRLKLRALAKGKDCQIRLPNVCNGNPETTVLAHIRRGGVAGTGQKPPDLCAVWACSDCHDCIDGRAHKDVAVIDREYAILHGLCRTLAEVSKEAIIGKK